MLSGKEVYNVHMNRLFKTGGCIFLAVLCIIASGFVSVVQAAKLQRFDQVEWIESLANDGDSFLVDLGDKQIHLRFYFVDCPETIASRQSDLRRLRAQTRYFGLGGGKQTLYFGQQAKAFVEKELSRPFTIHTAFANAMGRSNKGRVYGFVTTANGEDLATLLVKEGLARSHGVGRKTPGGRSRKEHFKMLNDLEAAAMLKRVGIWAESDPDQIVAYREEQRQEERELAAFQKQTQIQQRQNKINLNRATAEALQSLKGIGPALAKKIIIGRPYQSLDDLIKVKGIGRRTLEKLRPFLSVK